MMRAGDWRAGRSGSRSASTWSASRRPPRWWPSRATSPSACSCRSRWSAVEPPPPAPPESPGCRGDHAAEPGGPLHPAPQTLMQDRILRVERTPDPADRLADRRYMASAEVPGPALPIPGAAGAGGLLLPSPEIPGAPSGRSRVGTGVARGGSEGVTSFARPLGGYQTTPHYPEARDAKASRASSRFRFEVLAERQGRHRAGAALRGTPGSGSRRRRGHQDLALRARSSRKGGSRRMGHLAGTLRAERPVRHPALRASPRPSLDRGGPGLLRHRHRRDRVGAQGIWDDPAFALYRQAVEAMDRKDYAQGQPI